jgi:hypothetical protein
MRRSGNFPGCIPVPLNFNSINTMTEFYSRRRFVADFLKPGAVLLGVALATGACIQKKPADEKAIKSCEDFSQVSEAELEKRKKFAYVKQAPDAAKQCSACKLFLPPKSGEMCGGCLLFKGPVDSKGSCTYWAPLDQAG